MASSIGQVLTNLSSKLSALGKFDSVATVEPKNAPGNGLTAAVFLASIAPAVSSGLNQMDGVYTFTVRIYEAVLTTPAAAIDTRLVDATDAVIDALAGAFTLGGTVRNVDFQGENGTTFRGEAGYIEVGGAMYRVVDITLPLIINDAFAEYVA